MIRYNIKQAIHQMMARKLTTSIQVIGLGIGLGSVILMMSFIIHEYSFDKYHKNSKNIYRVINEKDCSTPYIMGKIFNEEITGVENVFRIYSLSTTQIKTNDEYIQEEKFLLVDSSFFNIMDIPLLSGNRNHLYQNTNDIVISDKTAIKYFGSSNPVGQTLEIIISGTKAICQISGVFKHFPSNSSIQADFLGNIKLSDYAVSDQSLLFTSGDSKENTALNEWAQKGFQTFLLLANNQEISSIESQTTLICQKHDKDFKQKRIHLQQLTDMYFHSEDLWNYLPLVVSNVKSIRLFEGIAILILLVAWFNYMLLSTAETRSQLKEIACRKIMGASSLQITSKVYTHSIMTAVFGLIPALLFISFTIPIFNQLFDKNIDMLILFQPAYIGAILGITLITGLAGGTYVSVYSIKQPPVNLFKSSVVKTNKRILSPSGAMIVFQFFIFILLTVSAIFIYKQVRYSETKSQGFNSNNVIVFKLSSMELRKNVNLIKTKLQANAHVQSVAISAFTPPSTGFIQLAIGNDKNTETIKEEALFVGADLIELLQIPVIDGGSFQEDRDYNGEIIINESTAKKYDVKAGDQLGSFKVRGILADFHVHSVHRPINPLLIMRMNDEGCYELTVRTNGSETEVIKAARDIWTEIAPMAFFEYELLNDRISSFYDKERKQVKTISFFSSLSIFLSVMGLFGFVSISLLKRTKEIGIRKVNGARVAEVMTLLNKDFIKWVIVAFVIACPIAWYAMHKWLQNFAYKTTLSWWVFAVTGAVAVAVALLTVSWQSWRAATRNPVEALRCE